MNTRLVDTKAAADHLGLAVVTLERARVVGDGPAFCRFGRAVRYRLCDLDEWASARRVTSTTQQPLAA